jgi:superfamily II DNA or RNA helicase
MTLAKEVTIASNAAISKLITGDTDARILLSELLSYFVMGYENMYSFKNKTWDGRSSMFDWTTGVFPSGFMDTVKLALVERGYEVTHVQKPMPVPMGNLYSTLKSFDFTGRYEYQVRNTEELTKRGGMISHLATGAGKTNAAAIAIHRINRPTLVLTKRQPLMYQFAERLEGFGFKVGLLGDNRSSIDPNLTVAMAQTINKRLEKGDPEIIEYLKTIEFIIGEEAHEVSDGTYWNVIRNCPNAYYKMALTATPFMRNNNEANMKLLAAFGPVGISVDEKTLIDRGILAKPVIKYARYDKPEKLKFGSNYQKAVDTGIVNADTRNDAIVKEAVRAVQHDLPVLVLVQRKEHGKALQALLEASGLRCEYIFGESKSDARSKALKRLETRKIDVLIGSSIVDVGVDVPAIGLVIMAGGGKAEVAYRQRIGRGLREKKKGPNLCFILDFRDEHNQYLLDHYKERLSIVKSTPGFTDCILTDEEDFPYHLFTT